MFCTINLCFYSKILFHSRYMWCVARFGRFVQFKKREKHPWRSVNLTYLNLLITNTILPLKYVASFSILPCLGQIVVLDIADISNYFQNNCGDWKLHSIKLYFTSVPLWEGQGLLESTFKLFPEAVTQRCSVKNVFLEISQNSQENTCARTSFLIKWQALGLQLY